MAKRWTESEKQYLIANYLTQTRPELAKNLNKTKFAIQNYIAKHLDIRKFKDTRPHKGDKQLNGLLIAISDSVPPDNSLNDSHWQIQCECQCENKTIMWVRVQDFVHERVTSCYCTKIKNNQKTCLKHGYAFRGKPHHLYCVWLDMKKRCYDKNCNGYKNYGGRGIQVCSEWKHNFKNFYDWAINHGYQRKLTIDRINNNENYSPNNCRFTDMKTQSRNRRNSNYIQAFGENKTVAAWVEDPRCQITWSTLVYRIKNGMTPEEAITKPAMR